MNSGDAVTPGDRPELRGVRGWLLVLCVYLMVLIPVKAALGLLGAWQAAALSTALRNGLIFQMIFELALAGFAVYAGMALYRLQRNGVSIAKIYFIVTLTLAVLGLGMVLLGWLAQPTDRVLANVLKGPATFASVSQILLSTAWLLYLERSMRVRANYSAG